MVEQYVRSLTRRPDCGDSATQAQAVEGLRRAAGSGAALLSALSPTLGEVLGVDELAAGDRHDQFAAAAASFLAGLARQAGGAVLQLDSVQWLDAASRRVLRWLAVESGDAPLLMVLTVRDDTPGVVEGLRTDLGSAVDLELDVAPLGEDGLAQLVGSYLGGLSMTREVAGRLTAATDANPLTVLEFLHAVVEAGLLRPHWGSWILDTDGLQRLDLPADLLDLITTRIQDVEPTTRQLLQTAAVIGTRFDVETLTQAEAGLITEAGVVAEAVVQGLARGILAQHPAGGYAFVHDRIREALLAGLDDLARRERHQRIAEALDHTVFDGGVVPVDSDRVYAVAGHYALGQTGRCPDRVFSSGYAAGRRALAEYAPAEAIAYLERAAGAAAAAGIQPDPDFHLRLGLAYTDAGRPDQAEQALGAALRGQPDALRRAVILGRIAVVQRSRWQTTQAVNTLRRAFAETGQTLPRRGLLLVLAALGMFLAGLVVGYHGPGAGTAKGKRRERYTVRAELFHIGSSAAGVGLDKRFQMVASLWSTYLANRLGPGPEQVRNLAVRGLTASVIGLRRRCDQIFDRATTMAAQLGDPGLTAETHLYRGVADLLDRRRDSRLTPMRKAIDVHGKYLETDLFFLGIAAITANLVLRGYPREAMAWNQRAATRQATTDRTAINPAEWAEITALALSGRTTEAAALLQSVTTTRQPAKDDTVGRLGVLIAATVYAVETDQLDEPFEQAVTAFHAAGVSPSSMATERRQYWIYETLGRLEQLRQASNQRAGNPHASDAELVAARRALRALRRVAHTGLMRSYAAVCQASFRQLIGENEKALDLLSRADRLIRRQDAPLVSFEAARVRARALQALGLHPEAARHARTALALAEDLGWEHRARWIRVEFATDDTPGQPGHRVTSHTDTTTTSAYGRRLAALEQVSLAASTILEPRTLARVALDETVRILGADRAFLFLLDDAEQLVPYIGRDAEGNDLDQPTDYGASLTQRVQQTGQPLVITGSDQGEALGSRSTVLYGLRSIMVAPLSLKNRLLGVVYLDSRIAKGMFTTDDVGILAAITHHIATCLETTRAAQLEVAVQAVRHERDLAEYLRATLTELNATLDPTEVLQRLLQSVTRAVPGHASCILRYNDGKLQIAAVAGHAPTDAIGRQPTPEAETDLKTLLQADGPVLGPTHPDQPSPIPDILGSAASWIAVPLTSRSEPIGLLLSAAPHTNAYQEAHTQITAALAGQGAVAYENARLYTHVRLLATTDALTGLHNRGHFFDLAETQVAIARRYDRPLSAIMLDIDHFKRINDTHGHTTGDAVIKEVANRLCHELRNADIIGRYGGEEFAIIMPETSDHAAEVAERLRAAIATTPITTATTPIPVTISIGVATLNNLPTSQNTLTHLLEHADAHLYQAKRTGRNRVSTAPDV
jgi:diguanylate cyclase (GGDEF)-like protein